MKAEYYNYKVGGQTLVYLSKEEGINPSVTARCYTACEGLKQYTLKLLEDGIYLLSINFKFAGKYILVVSEDSVRKLVVVATVSD